uniref:Uncharacterized protein n=1 Tax=Romanomermis culicivorax TaxID=13658 RepID=A0A915K267_ROMCU
MPVLNCKMKQTSKLPTNLSYYLENLTFKLHGVSVKSELNPQFQFYVTEKNQLVHFFKLKGYPWMANGSETVAARFLVSTILVKVSSIGWPVLTSLDISRRANDKGVFVLRSASGLSLPSSIPSPSYFCVSLNETDKIRLINAPSHIGGMLKNVVGTYWSAGICREQEYFGSYEMKLNGAPWNGMETQDSLAANKSGSSLTKFPNFVDEIFFGFLEENFVDEISLTQVQFVDEIFHFFHEMWL